MRTLLRISSIVLATQVVALSQSSSIRIAGVDEPPELTGEPKKTFPKPSDALQQFGTIMNKWSEHDLEKVKAVRPDLDTFIEKHPDYSDAYAIRAMADLCYLKRTDYAPIIADIEKAIDTHSAKTGENMFGISDLYAIRGKVNYEMGRYQAAMDDLEAAMKQKIDDADNIFMTQGTNPDTSDAFLWSKADVDRTNTLALPFGAHCHRCQ